EWTFPCHGKGRGFKSHRGRSTLAEAKPARRRVGLQHRCSEVRLLLPTLDDLRPTWPVSLTVQNACLTNRRRGFDSLTGYCSVAGLGGAGRGSQTPATDDDG